MSKYKLTVRFVLERDFEIETTGENFASYFQVGDWMVSSGYCNYPGGNILNDSIFEKPIANGELLPINISMTLRCITYRKAAVMTMT